MTQLRERRHVFGDDWQTTRSGLYLPPTAAPKRRPIAVDLFAGAGGFSCGFHQAGWHVAAAVEYDTAACCTYLLNLGGPDTILWTGPVLNEELRTGDVRRDPSAWTPARAADVMDRPGQGWISHEPDAVPCEHMFKGDVRALTGDIILDALGLDQGDVDCVIGGPPCQGFSLAGKRDVMDPRNSLVFDFARIVCEIQPKAFVMENVRGIASMVTAEGVPVLDALALVFESGGMGTYDALRKSLYASSGAGMAVTGKPKPKAATDAGPDQEALW